jgi:hypothetical protein
MVGTCIRLLKKARLDAVRAIPFGCACVLCTVLGWYCVSPFVLRYEYIYDHGYGETAISKLEGGLIGLAMPLFARLFRWWIHFTDYRTHGI